MGLPPTETPNQALHLRPNAMTEVLGIDHIYITVSDLPRSESFYDHVLLDVLGFRKNKFSLGDDPHVQYFNRHFGYVLRPSRNSTGHDSYSPGLHHFAFASSQSLMSLRLPLSFVLQASMLRKRSSIRSTRPTIGQPFSLTPMEFASKSQIIGRSAKIAMTIGDLGLTLRSSGTPQKPAAP